MSKLTTLCIGSFVLSIAAPAMAQSSTPASAPVPGTSASEPLPNSTPGTDPTWMVVDVGIALVAGLVVGYLIGAWRSSARQHASHA